MNNQAIIKSLFANRKLVIATKHKKEIVIAPITEAALSVTCFAPENLDTDTLGTFTDEVERTDDPITTARKKCQLALAATNCDLAIASEGSFGSHPAIFFAQADEEILIFIDKKNNLEIIARELSTETNFNGSEIRSEIELKTFAESTKFPSHALILRKEKNHKEVIYKGITDWSDLRTIFQQLMDTYGKVYAETDMRAMFNPTRMNVIKKAAIKLTDKIASCCPKCSTPGFSVTQAKAGLPCSACGLPTQSTLYHVYSCIKCQFTTEKKYPYDKLQESPQFCDYCNP